MNGRSLRTKLLLGALLPALVCFLAAGGAGYVLARRTLEEQLGQSLAADAALVASQVETIRLLSVEPGDDVRQTRSYRRLIEQVEAMRVAAGARRVFLVDLDGRVRADAGGGLPVGAQVPELGRDRRELEQVKRGIPTSSQVLFVGPDGGIYRTGYAAIFDEGRWVGTAGVEGSAAFFRPLGALARGYALLATVVLVLLALVSLALARGLTRPLRDLMRAAVRIGQGDLGHPVPLSSTGEVSVLARELELMRQALQARDRQLQLMLAGIAHEVKNPLGGIELFAGLLREELPEGDARSHVDRIRGELDYLKRIVDEFLSFARDPTVAHAPIAADQWVAQVVPLVVSEARSKQVELRTAIAPAPLTGDENLLGAALLNLARNAIQASPAGSVVDLTGHLEGDHYVVEVKDHGPGIPEASRERVFEAFFSTREKGTGLGLPLARKIVQAHGGALTFSCGSGETVFRMVLPLGTDVAAERS